MPFANPDQSFECALSTTLKHLYIEESTCTTCTGNKYTKDASDWVYEAAFTDVAVTHPEGLTMSG